MVRGEQKQLLKEKGSFIPQIFCTRRIDLRFLGILGTPTIFCKSQEYVGAERAAGGNANLISNGKVIDPHPVPKKVKLKGYPPL
jgi:hypothetical protein